MTFKGTVTFQSPFTGFQFKTIDIFNIDHQIIKASIGATESEGILLVVELDNLKTYKDATRKARGFASHIARMLTFEFKEFHQSFKWLKDTLIEERPDDSTIISTIGVGVGFESRFITELGEKQLNNLKETLQNKPLDLFYYDQFYFALGLTDPISKFMGLYNITLSLCNDRQENVDKFILQIQPHIPTNPPYKPRKSNVPETLYTRLRNQIAHVKGGTTIESTKREMEQSLGGLTEITKEKINQTSLKS